MFFKGDNTEDAEYYSLFYTLGSWSVLVLIYFSILMLLQRTISQERAIGGQVSWKSIIFKTAEVSWIFRSIGRYSSMILLEMSLRWSFEPDPFTYLK